MIEVLMYLICFLIYVFIQGLVINGLKACTEGHYEIMPDGNKIAKGMIFFRIADYFNRNNVYQIYYKDNSIKELLNTCKEKFGNSIPVSFLEGTINNTILKIKQPDAGEEHMILQFKNTIIRKENAFCAKWAENEYVFYKEYERYKFPKFIRKSVFLNCIKCASSFWGTVTYVPVVVYFGVNWWVGLGWIASMFSLTYVAYWLYKRL
jgi:hypothetical protein